MNDTSFTQLKTVEEFAEFIQVSPKTIYKWIKEGKIDFAIDICGQKRFRKKDILKYLEKNIVKNSLFFIGA